MGEQSQQEVTINPDVTGTPTNTQMVDETINVSYGVKESDLSPKLEDYIAKINSVEEKAYGRMSLGSGHSISDNTETIVHLNTKTYTEKGITADTVNYRFTALTAGKYLVCANLRYNTVVANKLYDGYICVNGNATSYGRVQTVLTNGIQIVVSDIVDLLPGDYVDLRTYQNSGGSSSVYPGTSYSYMSITKI